MFEAVIVDEGEIAQGRGRPGRPTLADDFEKLIESAGIEKLIERNEKSAYFAAGGYSESVIRSAARFHGLRVNFAKTKAGGKVFRFAGRYVPLDEDTRRERVEKAAATRAVNGTKVGAKPKDATKA